MKATRLLAGLCTLITSLPLLAGETLYNGIILPDAWPPSRCVEELRRGDVMDVPYLKAPPAVIPIDVGRQLFVDDFLIEQTTMKRVFHKAQDWEGNPMLRPDKRWEKLYENPKTAIAFSDDASGGTLTTRPLKFSGKHLFVNVAAASGELRAELLDADGKVIAPFSAENCEPITTDSTNAAVKWKGAGDLAALAGKPARVRFHTKNAALYAFWISPDANGASHGYVAAGGPGFTTNHDTTGK